MKRRHPSSPARLAISCLALVVLCGLVVVVPRSTTSRFPAVVKAAHTLQLASIGPGRYQWSLRHGRPPAGHGLVNEQMLLFERSELVELELRPGLSTGDVVEVGDVVASVRSLRSQRRLAELKAQQQVLVARRQLLLAGERPAQVQQAENRVQLARAVYEAKSADLERIRALAARGLVSTSELEVSELEDEVHRLGIEVARGEVAVARSPAQPAAVAEVDAQIAAIEAAIAEIRELQQEQAVVSPIDGVVEVGGVSFELAVFDIDTVFLSFPVAESRRASIEIGHPVVFTTAAVGSRPFAGEVVGIAEAATMLAGQSVFWVSARLPNPDHLLCDGLIGSASLGASAEQPALWALFAANREAGP